MPPTNDERAPSAGVSDSALIDVAETVAAISCELQETLLGFLQEERDRHGDLPGWPENSFHAPFGGFPGWWRFCAEVGLVAERRFSAVTRAGEKSPPDWIAFIDAVVELAFEGVVVAKGPLPTADLHAVVDAALRRLRD